MFAAPNASANGAELSDFLSAVPALGVRGCPPLPRVRVAAIRMGQAFDNLVAIQKTRDLNQLEMEQKIRFEFLMVCALPTSQPADRNDRQGSAPRSALDPFWVQNVQDPRVGWCCRT